LGTPEEETGNAIRSTRSLTYLLGKVGIMYIFGLTEHQMIKILERTLEKSLSDEEG